MADQSGESTAHLAGLRMDVKEGTSQITLNVTSPASPPLAAGIYNRDPVTGALKLTDIQEFHRRRAVLPALLAYLNRGGRVADLFELVLQLQDLPLIYPEHHLVATADTQTTIWQLGPDKYLYVLEEICADDATEAEVRRSLPGHFLGDLSEEKKAEEAVENT